MPNIVNPPKIVSQIPLPSLPKKPNETGTISVQSYFRISDPATEKTIVEGRG